MTATPLHFRDVEQLYQELASMHGPFADLPSSLAECEAQYSALAARMDETAVPLLVTLIRHLRGSRSLFDGFVGNDAAMLLQYLAKQRPEPVARELLACMDADGPAEAIDALGDTGVQAVTEPLLQRVTRRHADAELRMSLADALELLDGPAARAELSAWLAEGDPSAEVQAELTRIAEALGLAPR
ncbi:hypothetical protein [Nannocystis bainbridge]|uniref:HEAT repeat domain-containing protein n=1 Tax=Nannocystis bainbridge TaxID=2995303 RepID=A0ABT5E443_9BACT|nr:hypothetical protein [Nannocystis bainbridge]MDC0720642.1 hypothetical protein [Nannocystis bainbridge]